MVDEGKTFVDAGEAAAWYEEKVREVLDDSEIVDEIFMYFGAEQTFGFSTQSPRTTKFSKLWRASESAHTMAALIVQRGRLWEAGRL